MRHTDQIDFKINILKWDCDCGFRWLAPLGTPESFPVRRLRYRSYFIYCFGGSVSVVEYIWAFVIWHVYDDTELLFSLKMLLRSFVILNCPSFYWENVDYIRDGDKYHFQQQYVSVFF